MAPARRPHVSSIPSLSALPRLLGALREARLLPRQRPGALRGAAAAGTGAGTGSGTGAGPGAAAAEVGWDEEGRAGPGRGAAGVQGLLLRGREEGSVLRGAPQAAPAASSCCFGDREKSP